LNLNHRLSAITTSPKKPSVEIQKLESDTLLLCVVAGSKGHARKWLFEGKELENILGRELKQEEKESLLKRIREAEVQSGKVDKLELKSVLDFQAEISFCSTYSFKMHRDVHAKNSD